MISNYLLQGDWSLWVTNYEVSNSGALVTSKKQGLVNLPMRGWQYFDGNTMQDDDTLTVNGKYFSCLTLIELHLFTEGEPNYPETLTVSSTEGASEEWPSVMGVYKITNITHSGRPVWQSTVREDRYLLYNGTAIL